MLISYNWLQTFFSGPLPHPTDIKQGLESNIFEVEDMSTLDNGDTVFEVDVLPNRASDCLSHQGIAREVAAIFSLPLLELKPGSVAKNTLTEKVEVEVKTDACRRYIGQKLTGVTVGPSPSWLADKIKIMGGKSINNMVDLTNFVLFDLGQPLHVFDADKVEGMIVVRQATAGEKMVTLDGKKLVLTTEDVVIADEVGVLALAGVKGGQKAEVTTGTKNIIVESANFEPAVVRKSATRHNLRTDAVKRFENNLSPEVAAPAIRKFTQLVTEQIPEVKMSDLTDVYKNKVLPTVISIKPEFIVSKLGLEISKEVIINILQRLHLLVEDKGDVLVVTTPFNRPDLDQPETLVEEVGRLYGYDKITSVLPPRESFGHDDISFRVAQKLRQILLEAGWSEIYDYAFGAEGDIELANPLTADRPFLKTNLTRSLLDSLEFNLKHLIFDNQAVVIFNIGTVFTTSSESKNIVIGVGHSKPKFHKNNYQVEEVVKQIEIIFGVNLSQLIKRSDTYTVIEFPLATLTKTGQADFDYNLQLFLKSEVKYKPISVYPRILRDVAVFVPLQTKVEMVREAIAQSAGELLVDAPILFDQFTKTGDSRTSLAFRLIFQSDSRTLEDKEVNDIMAKVYLTLQKEGWEVR
ncbi:MAG: phenylalanine--tRNA ligase subunit beta [Candidatus Paceibacterota bacterium]